MGLPIRIVIADDHPVVRDGLRRILEIERDMTVIGEAASGGEAVTLAQKLQPDVLLLDLMMPGISGLDALRDSNAQLLGETHILVLTAVNDRHQLIEAVRMHVHGIISKDEPIDKLLKAVRTVAAGKFWIERELLAEAAQRRVEPRGPKFALSPREFEIIITLASGASNKELAEKLGISELTVKRHLTNIYQKVGVASRLELALFAITNQIRPPDKSPHPHLNHASAS